MVQLVTCSFHSPPLERYDVGGGRFTIGHGDESRAMTPFGPYPRSDDRELRGVLRIALGVMMEVTIPKTYGRGRQLADTAPLVLTIRPSANMSVGSHHTAKHHSEHVTYTRGAMSE